jgi:hypothetical protein
MTSHGNPALRSAAQLADKAKTPFPGASAQFGDKDTIGPAKAIFGVAKALAGVPI